MTATKTTKTTKTPATKAPKVAKLDKVAQDTVAETSAPSLLSALVTQQLNADTKLEEAKPSVTKNQGVGQFIRNLITEGLDNKTILARVHEWTGNTNTSYACVAWYRSNINKGAKAAKQRSAMEWVRNFAAEHDLDVAATEELLRKVA